MKPTLVVIDFETTGLSPARGARATEVAAVRLSGDEIVDTYQSLMNPGVPVPPFIQTLTGITDEMVRNARPNREVIAELCSFVGDASMAAHNARFDAGFLQAECARARIRGNPAFVCTMKLARRVYPNAGRYSLAALLEYADIPRQGPHHRALSDAVAAAELLLQMRRDIRARHRLADLDFTLMKRLERTPIAQAGARLDRWARNG